MFLPRSDRPRRRPFLTASLLAHAALVAFVGVAPVLALEEPPEPEERIPPLILGPPTPPPITVTLTPPASRRGGGGRSPATATAPSPTERAPWEIPSTLPTPPDAPFEKSGTGPPGLPQGASVGAVEPGGCDGCPPGPVDARAPGVTPPLAVSVPPPRYPETARRARLQGRVVVRAVIGADGHVHDAEVVAAPNPLLSEAARRAILGWVYQPARLDGRAVACFLEVTLDFRIE